jgi:hypothetical protein
VFDINRGNAFSLRLSYTLCRVTTMGQKDREVRMSLQTLRVLETFLDNPTEQLAGAEVHQRCGLASGTLYPILLRLESASGSARLDDAALKLARAGSGHYRATTEDGQPVNSCYPFGVRFQLRK